MNNYARLIDYTNTIHNKLLALLFVSSNLIILPLIVITFVSAFFISKLILKKRRKSNGLIPKILYNITFSGITLSGLIIINLVDIIISGENKLLFLITYLTLFAILIRIVNTLILVAFGKYSYSKILNRLVSIMLWITAIVAISDSHDDIVNFLDNIIFHIGKKNTISVWDILHSLATIIITIVVAMLINRYLEKKIASIKNIDNNLQQIFIRSSKICVFVIAFLTVMPLIGVDITALSVFGGAVGVGLGFGLQKIASNFLSGFIILLDRSIKVGDRLVVDNNIGVVSKITTRYVVLSRFDGTETLIPNETFVTSSIQNQSYSSALLRFEVVFAVSDGADIAMALRLIGQVLQLAPNSISDKATASITRLIDNGVEIKGYFWLADPKHFQEANNFIYIQVLQVFKQNNINTPTLSVQKIEMVNQ